VRPDLQAGDPAGAVRALGADLVALLRVRAELVSLELEEEAARRKRLLVLGGLAALFSVATLVLVTALVVVFFWDTYRIAALAGVTAVYAVLAAWAYARFRELASNSPPPFSATIAEFRKDLEMLRGSDDKA
jgi:uncharacterized membrane protein YqjE